MTFLRNTWYVAAWAREIQPGKLLRRGLLGEYYVLFRDAAGEAKILLDRCPHRFAQLSRGKLVGDGSTIQCPYHGLQFNAAGHCVHNPHGDGRIPQRAVVPSLPIVERFSAIWAWMGDAEKADASLVPDFPFLDPDKFAVACDVLHVKANYELETDNILDLSHIEYLHPLFASPGVSRGSVYECVQDGDTVWSKRFIKDDDLPEFLNAAFGVAPGQKADRWLNARWNAPACMALWTGGVASGRPPAEGHEAVGAHIFTPETETTTHYFFANSTPWSVGPDAQQIAEGFLSVATGPDGVFTNEDGPMLEAQAENLRGQEFWSMKPIVLSIDAAGVRARRMLAKMIESELQSFVTATRTSTTAPL